MHLVINTLDGSKDFQRQLYLPINFVWTLVC